MLRHFYCPVGSFIQFYLCVGSFLALFNSVGWSLDDMFRGGGASLYGVYL